MIKLDFGEWGGGSRAFRTRAQMFDYLDQQRSYWVDDPELAPFMAAGGPNGSTFRELGEAWARVINRVKSADTQFPDLDETFQATAQGHIDTARVISVHSSIGDEIRNIALDEGVAGGALAVSYVRAKPNEFPLQHAAKQHLEVAQRLWARANAIDSESAKKTRASIRRILSELEALNAEHGHHLEKIAADHQAAFDEATRDLEGERSSFAEYRAQTAVDIAKDRERWQAEWELQRRLYIEQLKLKAAVTEWADRASSHEQSFRNQRAWVVGVGLGGVLVAVLWSWGALTLAHWLFADALVQGGKSPAVGTLRPTWIHELIFAASASLLYLTMYLWTMRVQVRMMMSEHHLGIDARSRASMAHTYLALLEDKGVTEEADRAIVLAALFRPVTDGLIKDDALPLISPATILSGQLAGR